MNAFKINNTHPVPLIDLSQLCTRSNARPADGAQSLALGTNVVAAATTTCARTASGGDVSRVTIATTTI